MSWGTMRADTGIKTKISLHSFYTTNSANSIEQWLNTTAICANTTLIINSATTTSLKMQTTTIKPPIWCPFSNPNELWLLKETFYGPQLSFWHCFDKINSMASPQNLCIYTGTFTLGRGPIYIGVYVYEFVHLSKSDAVEQHLWDSISRKPQVKWKGD